MPGNRIYELIARKLSGEASEAELQELNALLDGSENDQYLFEILDNYWSQKSDLPNEEMEDEEERFKRIISQETLPGQTTPAINKRAGRRWFYFAAAAVMTGTIITLIYLNNNKTDAALPAHNQPQISEVVARPGSRSKLILPDGTQVWLNAESKLSYLNTFNSTLREVDLEGEAYFDVTHDSKRPFIVHTSNIDIKVLGTAFSVKSYATDKTIETTLIRGSVEVVKKDDPTAPKVILRPHEKLVFNKELSELITQSTDSVSKKVIEVKPHDPRIAVTTLQKNKPDSTREELAWVYNKLIFEGDRLDEIAVKLERWYDVKITIKNERLKSLRLKATFENEPVGEAIKLLAMIAPFDYRITGNEVEIFKK